MVRRKTKQKMKKVGGIRFFISALLLFALGACFLLHSALICSIIGTKHIHISNFFIAFLGTLFIMHLIPSGSFRIFIHEIKHSIFILLTGNKIKNIEVGRKSGNVSYQYKKSSTAYLSLIALAPYYFPLLSLPVLIAGLIFDNNHSNLLHLLLGITLAFDLNTCFHDIHKEQEDFRQILGGFLMAALYIGGALFCWVSLCLLWIIAHNNGIIFCFQNTLLTIKNHII